MADAPAAPPRPRGMFTTLLLFVAVFFVFSNQALYGAIGRGMDRVLGPVLGFGGAYPVFSIMLGGTLLVLLTTLVRHFTTDWLEMAKAQNTMRHFQKELQKARKENNTYRLKKLQDRQMDILQMQQQAQARQMRTMPLTMVVVVPLFAWMGLFISRLDYWFFTTPWNEAVDMFRTNGVVFGSSVFPHWILLYMALSIPLGALAQKAMKYLSWRERWQRRHPEVHEK